MSFWGLGVAIERVGRFLDDGQDSLALSATAVPYEGVTQPVVLLHSPQDHVVPPVDSARILSRISSTDVKEILLEQSYHVATLDHDAERIFQESTAVIGRLAPGAVKESGLGTEGTTTGG